MSQWVEDLVLSLLWLRFDPWPGNFHMLRARSKKKKKKSFNIQPSVSKNYNCALTADWVPEFSEMLFLGLNPQIWLK